MVDGTTGDILMKQTRMRYTVLKDKNEKRGIHRDSSLPSWLYFARKYLGRGLEKY